MCPKAGWDVVCAYQWDPESGFPHRCVMMVPAVSQFCAIGSARNHNVFRVELDSHADTCVVGQHALVIQISYGQWI